MEIYFLAVLKDYEVEHLPEILYSAFDVAYLSTSELEETTDYDKLTILYQEEFDKKILVRFKVDFSDFERLPKEEVDSALENFKKELLESDYIDSIFKFQDNFLLQQNKFLFEELFQLEMKLREILTFIFLKKYGFNSENWLQSLQISNPKESPQNFENDLYNISFKDYKQLLTLKDLNNKEIQRILELALNFEDYRAQILGRGIQDEKGREFISSLSVNMDSLELVRNRVMHAKEIDKNLLSNFEKSISDLNDKIQTFWNADNRTTKHYPTHIEKHCFDCNCESDFYIEGCPTHRKKINGEWIETKPEIVSYICDSCKANRCFKYCTPGDKLEFKEVKCQ